MRQSLGFVPVATVHARVAGAQQQEITARQQQHVQCNNSHTRRWTSYKAFEALIITYCSLKPVHIIGTPVFALFNLQRPRDTKPALS